MEKHSKSGIVKKVVALVCICVLLFGASACGKLESADMELVADKVIGEYVQIGKRMLATERRTFHALDGGGTAKTVKFEAEFKPTIGVEVFDAEISVSALSAKLSVEKTEVEFELIGTEQTIEAGQEIEFYVAPLCTQYKVVGTAKGGKFEGYYLLPRSEQEQHWAYVVYNKIGEIVKDTRLPLYSSPSDAATVLSVTDAQRQAFLNLHYVMHSGDENSRDFLDAAKNFIAVTNGTVRSVNEANAEQLLIQSLIEYLYFEAPEDEQNLFMILELLLAGSSANGAESDLDRLYALLLDKKGGSHIAYKHYLEYKAACNDNVTPIIESCLHRFSPINAIPSGWHTESGRAEIFLPNEEIIPFLAELIVITFGDGLSTEYDREVRQLLQTVYSQNKATGKPIRLSSLKQVLEKPEASDFTRTALKMLLKWNSEFEGHEWKWSDVPVSLQDGRELYPLEFIEPIEDCIGFTIKYGVTKVEPEGLTEKFLSARRDIWIEIDTPEGKQWKKLGSYDPKAALNQTAELKISFKEFSSFPEKAVVYRVFVINSEKLGVDVQVTMDIKDVMIAW